MHLINFCCFLEALRPRYHFLELKHNIYVKARLHYCVLAKRCEVDMEITPREGNHVAAKWSLSINCYLRTAQQRDVVVCKNAHKHGTKVNGLNGRFFVSNCESILFAFEQFASSLACLGDKFIIINRPKWVDHDVKLNFNISSDVNIVLLRRLHSHEFARRKGEN